MSRPWVEPPKRPQTDGRVVPSHFDRQALIVAARPSFHLLFQCIAFCLALLASALRRRRAFNTGSKKHPHWAHKGEHVTSIEWKG